MVKPNKLDAKKKKKKQNGVIYLDTPGWTDMKIQEVTANSITEALTQKESISNIFVVLWSAVKLQEKVLRRKITSPFKCSRFPIIINKLSRIEYKCLKTKANRLGH